MNNTIIFSLALLFAPLLIGVAGLYGHAGQAGFILFAGGAILLLASLLRGTRWYPTSLEAEDVVEDCGGPVMYLPIDLPWERRDALWRKEREYLLRLDGHVGDYDEHIQDSRCKWEILNRLLRDGHVAVWPVYRYVGTRFGRSFRPKIFARACRVIEDYIETGGQWLTGGTGLH